ncbi:hypothetical protein BT96DRAFT_930217 [Gymnopus androsaceus JB14]|uniref:Uncharacterized protein n=1 Tax=Gymnopus androsaceus JB14 TaxID=1447944 RepID=A0A6A4GB97_9AGAR|nr:hypothetical protein BT96DRAFT_930217 [Gymnopus androsaceus JB14]
MDAGFAPDIGMIAYFPKITANSSFVKSGFVSKVVEGGREEVVAAALALAQVIAEKTPIGVSGAKRLLNHARDHT